jgi:hypothetical protein
LFWQISFLKDTDDLPDAGESKRSSAPSPSLISSSSFGSTTTQTGGSSAFIAKPKNTERGVSGDTVRSGHSDEPAAAPRFHMEELLRAMYFIAQVYILSINVHTIDVFFS